MSEIFSSIKNTLAPVHRAGYPFVGGFVLLALVLSWLWPALFWPSFLVAGFCAYFFRDPARVTPIAAGLVIAPADGRITHVGPALPPPELALEGRQSGSDTGDEQPSVAPEYIRISIFMSVFDIHVNRSPCAGEVRKIVYRAGRFLSADLDKASDDNERSSMVLACRHGDIIVVQIAGLIARRIVGFVEVGQRLDAGERFGLIRFGSRVDVYVPQGTPIRVGPGQRAIAGETVLAVLGPQAPPTAAVEYATG